MDGYVEKNGGRKSGKSGKTNEELSAIRDELMAKYPDKPRR